MKLENEINRRRKEFARQLNSFSPHSRGLLSLDLFPGKPAIERKTQMNRKLWKMGVFMSFLALSLLSPNRAQAQADGVTLSGRITGSSGTAIPNAKISIKNLSTGLTADTRSDLFGHYEVSNLLPGDYEISVTTEAFGSTVSKVTVTAEARQVVNLTVGGALALGDLGFPQSQTLGSDVDQARLDKRSHMLKIHQELGLITTAPLVATCITGGFAGGKANSSSNRDLHIALGSVTAGMYFTTAYYAMFAPRVPGTKTRGSIKLHKALVYVHGPGMILTPILGAMAFDEKSRGEKVHGIAAAHGAVALITAGAFGASILAVSLKW
jgi:hypothetical protein